MTADEFKVLIPQNMDKTLLAGSAIYIFPPFLFGWMDVVYKPLILLS
jgi:hypothetical protein